MELNDVKVNPHDLRHPLGAIEYVEFLQKQAKGLIERYNGIPTMIAFIAVTRNLNGEPYSHVGLMVLTTEQLGLTDSGRDKQFFSLAIKQVAQKGEALMICILSEAWTLEAKNEEEVSIAKEWIKTHDGIEGCPLRQDSVMIQVEHKSLDPRHQMWVAPIHTMIDGKRTVGDFVNKPNSADGRFCLLLPD